MIRRRGPRLVGTMARTAVVVGTAGHVANKQAQKHAAQAAASAPQPDAVAAAPPQDAPAETDYVAEIQQLASLQQSGVITAEEFEAKKRQILGI